MQNLVPISAVLITKNCGDIFDKTLLGLGWCDEIIVVDSGSTDNTIEICKKYNCRLFTKEFDGYGPQKKYAVRLAKNDWILSVDGDEVVTSGLRDEIMQEIIKNKNNYQGYYTPVTLVFLGKKFLFGKENKFLHLRLFNRKYGNFNLSLVHEGVELSGKTSKLKHEILHYSYSDIHHYFEKFNLFTSSYAESAFNNYKKTNIFIILFKFPANFLHQFIIRLNILNGFQGFVWSLFSAFYSFVKLIKLFELQHKK